ncbi:MBL fold metallo-hydrolase [Kitasatospora sp. NPDC058965]|uniref:MBL fold metallo-hydrolase n=1 Tax=Kitasatospora sp. NPDC058965 TaxID=3346682 RepID=UPI0036C08D76
MDNENVQRITLGDVEIIRLVEWRGAFMPAGELVPDAPPEVWQRNADWLAPDHWERESDRAAMALQTWVVRSAGRTVVIDPGVGNGRERPGSPFHHWQGDFPGLLAAAGIEPEEVDTVVNTHLHVDHVGWNTKGLAGGWVPTFPNARYLMPAADDHYYGPDNGYAKGLRESDRLIYQDSIAPIHRAGLAVLWDEAYRIDEHLTLEAAPGHTPGSSVLRVRSGGDRAVFVGDLVHSPVQLLAPSCSSCLCLDPAGAATSRRRILERAAELNELVIPAHFGGAGAVEVRSAGGGFALGAWREA